MNLKITLILIGTLFLIPNVCLAKKIEIDDFLYDVNDILNEDNFTYDSTTDTLILKNATLKSIKTDENLKLILEGENKIITETIAKDSIIVSKNLEISGDGSLKIINDTSSAIIANHIFLNNVTLDLEAFSALKATTDIIVDNTVLNINANEALSLNRNLILNNSKINILKTNSVIKGNNLNIFINSTSLDVNCSSFTTDDSLVYITGNSNIKIYNPSIKNYNFKLGSNLEISESSDGTSYKIVTDTIKENYVNIYCQDDLNLELETKEQNLNEKEKALNQKTEDLKIKELNLVEKEQVLKTSEFNLITQEEKLKQFENELIKTKEALTKKELELATRETLNINQEEELRKLKDTLSYQEKELTSKSKTIQSNLSLLKEYESSLKNKEENLNKREVNLNNYVKKSNQINTLESINNIENPKTNDKILTSIIVFVSLLLGVVVLGVIKAKRGLNGEV